MQCRNFDARKSSRALAIVLGKPDTPHSRCDICCRHGGSRYTVTRSLKPYYSLTGYGPLSLTGLREFDSHKNRCIIIYSTRRHNYRQSHHSDDKPCYDKSTTRLLSIQDRLQRLRLLRLLPLHRLPRERGRVGIFISLISSLANRLRSVGISI